MWLITVGVADHSENTACSSGIYPVIEDIIFNVGSSHSLGVHELGCAYEGRNSRSVQVLTVTCGFTLACGHFLEKYLFS